MFKDILYVPGKPGLFRLLSKGAKMSIVESLIDKKRMPVYMFDKSSPICENIMFTVDGDKRVGDILIAIKEKEEGKPVSFDLKKVDGGTLRAYFAEVVPTYDRDKVYPTDILKVLKWYNILIECGITDFSTDEPVKEDSKEEPSENEALEEGQETLLKSSQPMTVPPSVKQKSLQMSAIQSVKTQKSKPLNVIPKKSIVGSKRGS